MVNIFLVDNHPLVIEGIKKTLHDVPTINIVGEAHTATDTLKLLVEKPVAHLVLLDLKLPDEDGVSVCKKLRSAFPGIKIIILTSEAEGSVVFKSLKAGANGYVLKNTQPDELKIAINKVSCGESYISREANDALINILQLQTKYTIRKRLTRREKEILMFLKQGLTNHQVAERLSLSTHTVDTHRKNMLQKFNVHNITALLQVIGEKLISISIP